MAKAAKKRAVRKAKRPLARRKKTPSAPKATVQCGACFHAFAHDPKYTKYVTCPKCLSKVQIDAGRRTLAYLREHRPELQFSLKRANSIKGRVLYARAHAALHDLMVHYNDPKSAE